MTVKSVEEMKSLGPGSYNIEYEYNGTKFHFHIFVGDIDENATINLNGYGSGVKQDGQIVDNYITSNTQNNINIRFQYGYDGYAYNGWDGAIKGIMSEISNTYGISLDNSMISGFSSTGGKTVHLVSDFVSEHDVNNSYALIIESVDRQSISPEERDSFINHNTTIINAYARDFCSLQNSSNDYKGVHMISC